MRRARGITSALGAAAVYGLLTLLITHPVPLRLRSVIAGGPPFDALQYTWSLWWVKEALFTLHTNPAHITWIHHPVGAYLPFLLAIPYVYLVGLPLSLFLPPPAVYNLELLSSFPLSGLTMYFLCAELTGNRWAAFIGGLIYAFFPGRIAHAAAGHLPHVTTYWFPLYALLLIRAVCAPAPRRAVLCGLSLGVSLLVHAMHIPYLVMPLTGVYLLYEFAITRRRWPDRHTLKGLALAFTIGVAVALPWFLPLLMATLWGQTEYMHSGGSVAFSADLLSFLTPSPFNPVLSRLRLVPPLAHRLIPHPQALYESLGYLGVIPLALGGWGAWRRWRGAGGWALLALGAAIFSLGPLLQVNGQLVTMEIEHLQTYIPMPYAPVAEIPFMEWGRTPGRLNGTVMFALSVLAAYGLADLLERASGRSAWAIITTLSLIIMAEFIPLWPFPTLPADVPAYLRHMAAEGSQGGVLNLPMTRRRVNHQALFYQTVHRHPVVGGYVHRDLPGIPGLVPFMEDLALPPPPTDLIPRPAPATITALLRVYDVRYVFLFEDYVKEDRAARDLLSAALGAPVSVEHGVSIFRVPAEAGEVGDPVYGLDRESWYPVEKWGAVPSRWMSDQAELYLYSTGERRGAFRFKALPFSPLQRLQIEVNDEPLPPLVIGDWMTYTTSFFTLQPGLNRIFFHALEGCTPFVGDPRCEGVARAASARCDPYLRRERCLSLLLQNVRFVPAPIGHTLKVPVGDRIRFLGYDLYEAPVPGRPFTLFLYWQALGELERDYTIFVHMLDQGGELLAQWDAPPLDGLYPTSRWVVGDVFTHRAVMMIPPDAPPGKYDLVVGMYTYPDLNRLPVVGDRPSAQDGLIWLQSVEIHP